MRPILLCLSLMLVVGAWGCGDEGGTVLPKEAFVCDMSGETRKVEDMLPEDYPVRYRGTCDDPVFCENDDACMEDDECLHRTWYNDWLARPVTSEEAAPPFELVCVPGPIGECKTDDDCRPDELCIKWPQGTPGLCTLVGCDNDDQCLPEEHCVIEDICELPAEVGPCDAAFPRWYHNAATDECEEFTYGGCGGNANNFETKEACEAACPPAVGTNDRAPKLSIAPRAGVCEPDADPVL